MDTGYFVGNDSRVDVDGHDYLPVHLLLSSQGTDALQALSFYLSRIDILFFIATMTTAALATTGFGNKVLLNRIAVYLFLISMGIFFISVLKIVLTPPWTV